VAPPTVSGLKFPCVGTRILDPEQRRSDGELGDDFLEFVGATEAEHLDRPEGGRVEVHGCAAVPHRQLGLRLRLRHGALSAHFRIVALIAPCVSRRERRPPNLMGVAPRMGTALGLPGRRWVVAGLFGT
jgi:hypothetical protein